VGSGATGIGLLCGVGLLRVIVVGQSGELLLRGSKNKPLLHAVGVLTLCKQKITKTNMNPNPNPNSKNE
jgi:hypothetical protein